VYLSDDFSFAYRIFSFLSNAPSDLYIAKSPNCGNDSAGMVLTEVYGADGFVTANRARILATSVRLLPLFLKANLMLTYAPVAGVIIRSLRISSTTRSYGLSGFIAIGPVQYSAQ
jgi:hypothetical protein